MRETWYPMRMKRILTAIAAGFVLVAGGCSSNEGPEPTAPAESSEAQATSDGPTSSPPAAMVPTEANERGNRLKAFGDLNGAGCLNYPTEPCGLQFTLDTPVDATECNSSYPAENGRLIAVPLTVETGAGDTRPFTNVFNPNSFSALQANGVTLPQLASNATYGCSESETTIPDSLAPESKYEGFVVLDVPVDAESLIFRTNIVENGWEWPLS